MPVIPKSAIFFDDIPNGKPENAFTVDKKANKDLRRYESVANLHLSKYKQKCFNCLGNPEVFVKDKKVDGKQKLLRYYGKIAYKQSRSKGHKVLPMRKENESSSKEYLRLPLDHNEKHSENSNEIGEYSCLDEATKLYSEGKGNDYSKPKEEIIDDYVMEEIFGKVAEFNKKTREDPKNVDMWLKFVNFQDIVAQDKNTYKTENIRLREVYQPTKVVIEKKLSILEKALEANPSSLQLKFAQMELYQDIFDEAKVNNELLFFKQNYLAIKW